MEDEITERSSVNDFGLVLEVAVKAEHEASRQDTSPLNKLWSWPWSSIRDAEQVIPTQNITLPHHIVGLDAASHQVNVTPEVF
jgi:hypothetical protein